MYPTARMIFVVLLGVPLALALALYAPGLWLFGGAWMALCVGLFLLDAIISADPSRLSFAARVPEAIAVSRGVDASVRLSFAGIAPSRIELAIDAGRLLDVTPERRGRVRHPPPPPRRKRDRDLVDPLAGPARPRLEAALARAQ
jgi:uncharacterized protein (DUF58 family)